MRAGIGPVSSQGNRWCRTREQTINCLPALCQPSPTSTKLQHAQSLKAESEDLDPHSISPAIQQGKPVTTTRKTHNQIDRKRFIVPPSPVQQQDPTDLGMISTSKQRGSTQRKKNYDLNS